MREDEVIGIAARVGAIVGDAHIHYYHREPEYDRFHFKHKKTGKTAHLSKETLKELSELEPDSDDPLIKHIVDLFA